MKIETAGKLDVETISNIVIYLEIYIKWLSLIEQKHKVLTILFLHIPIIFCPFILHRIYCVLISVKSKWIK